MYFQGDEYSLLIILPDKVEGLESVEEKLVNYNFQDIISDLFYIHVNVRLPKFKLEKQIELNSVLKQVSILLSDTQ